jgi:hypothetical protein
VQSFGDAGGSIVGRTNQAFNTAVSFGLLTGTVVNGNGSGNGSVDVDTPEGSIFEPVAQDASFIYPAYWFTGLGENVKVEERYAAGNPLLSGHWRATSATNGPENAAGNASVVSSEAASGARSVVFGTSVFFRTHPKGGLSQAARAIFWAAPEGDDVLAPDATSVALTGPAAITYPEDATFGVEVAGGEGVPTGTVELVDGAESVLASGELVDGVASLTVPGLLPGVTTVTAVFTPDAPAFEPSVSEPVDVVVGKAPSTTDLDVRKVGDRKVRTTVEVLAGDVVPVGTVVIKDKGKVVKQLALTEADGGTGTLTMKLAKGKHTLVAVFRKSELVKRSVSEKVSFKLG